jgi:hypothetical protein
LFWSKPWPDAATIIADFYALMLPIKLTKRTADEEKPIAQAAPAQNQPDESKK